MDAEDLYQRTGRWLKYADKHRGGWAGDDPRCLDCKQPIRADENAEYDAGGYVHRGCREADIAREVQRARERRGQR